jgi:hypothetical protein
MRSMAADTCGCSTRMEPVHGPAEPDPGDEYGFQPIVGFDGEGRPVAAWLRPARRPARRCAARGAGWSAPSAVTGRGR